MADAIWNPATPVEPQALASSIAVLEAWDARADGDPLTQDESESLSLALHELKRLRAAPPSPSVAAPAEPVEPTGWVTMWPSPRRPGHEPVYTAGPKKPEYGPELDARLTITPVYAAPQPPRPGTAPLSDEQIYARRETYGEVLCRITKEAEAGIACDVVEADALEFRREQYGLTAADFAAVLGMQQSHYSEVVNQRRRLPINAVARAVAIGVPAAPLLAGRGIGPTTPTPKD